MTPIDEYLLNVAEPHLTSLTELRKTLRELLPAAEEVISYSMPGFRVIGGVVAGFAAFKNHVSYFPHSGNIVPQLTPQELVGLDGKEGTLRFQPGQILPRQIVHRLVSLRLQEIEEQLMAKSRKGRGSASQ